MGSCFQLIPWRQKRARIRYVPRLLYASQKRRCLSSLVQEPHGEDKLSSVLACIITRLLTSSPDLTLFGPWPWEVWVED